MAWRFRRSARLPLGFRLNFSKSGIGYSWGVRGFRIGKDSKGRVVRTLSIPGTGIYSREYITQKSNQYQQPQPVTSASDSRVGLFVSLGAVSLLIGALAHSILVFVVLFAVGTVLLQLGSSNRTIVRSPVASAITEQSTTFQSLGFQAIRIRLELMHQLKNEMQRLRMASQFDLYFDSDLSDVVFHFATIDGPARPAVGLLCLGVLGAIHPKQWQGFTGENAAELINNIVFNSTSDYRSLKEPSLLRFARCADERGGSQLAERLGAFLYELARQAAFADGNLSQREQEELAQFLGLLDTPAARPLISDTVKSAQSELSATQPPTLPHSITEHIPPPVSASHDSPNIESGQSSRSDESIDRLVTELKTFLAEVEPPLKAELRKLRSAGSTREFLENDIRNLIVRVGVSDSDVSPEAAQLHLALFSSLHPKTFAWSLEVTKDFMRNIVNRDPKQYSGAYPKPLVLKLMESFDTVSGTRYATKVREMYYRVAVSAATRDGRVTPETAPALDAVRTGLELREDGVAAR